MRVAAYYAPALNDPLWSLGANWLGRDPETGAIAEQPDVPGIAEITAEPWMYGFHATLKPPMRLRPGASWDAVITAADDIAATLAPFELAPLKIDDVHGFLAIVDAEPSAALQQYADACVAGLDPFRLPPDADEMARRRKPGHTPQHKAMLARWGYPYVFKSWFFHMTLTRRLSPEEHAIYRPAAERVFSRTLRATRRVTDICLFVQSKPDAPFMLAERLPLRG